MIERLVVAEINIANLAHNFSSIKSHIGPNVKVMSVIKGNAYGHGDVEVAKLLQKLGTNYFGVVCLYEAGRLREAGISKPILLLNYNPPEIFAAAIDLDLSLNIMDERSLAELDKVARKKGKRTRVHVKVDTGMHRLGLLPDEALKFIPAVEKYKNLFLEGIFTHFATSDEADLSFSQEQLAVFNKLIDKLKDKGINLPLIHSANSAAVLRLPNSHFTMVRPGKILYGLAPSLDFQLPFEIKPLLKFKTQIVQLRWIHKGEAVGYGRTFVSEKDTLVAALPVGYADGFRRGPNNWGEVLVHGQRVPLLGRVSMDQSSIDVTTIEGVKVGDEVVLIGKQGNEEITTWDVAKKLGTISYEVTTSLSARVSRNYIDPEV